MLPARAGEARAVLTRPGGVAAVEVARQAGTVVVGSPVLRGSLDAGVYETRRRARKDAKVSAILHTSSPVRIWDHDLGPGETHLMVVAAHLMAAEADGADGAEQVRDLTPAPARALDEASFAVTPDGSTVVTTWSLPDEPGFPRSRLVAIDTTSGDQRVLADEPGVSFSEPDVTRDGRFVVCVRTRDTTYDDPPRVSLWLLELASGDGRELPIDVDLWPGSPAWATDGTAVFFTADERGHRPVFRVDAGSGATTRVTAPGTTRTLSSHPTAGPFMHCATTSTARRPRCDSTRWPPTGQARPCRHRAALPRRVGSRRSRQPSRTAQRCKPGSPCPPARASPPLRRCCCGSTAVH